MDPELIALGSELAKIVVTNTAQTVQERIRAARARHQDTETIQSLEQIITELIDEKANAVRIAQAYQSELVGQRISDDDVKFIADNVIPLLEKLAQSSGTGGAQLQQTVDLASPLLSTETFKIMQLLGFNFRAALGEPLTTLVRSFILARVAPNSEDAAVIQKLDTERELTLLRVLEDPAAAARFQAYLDGRGN